MNDAVSVRDVMNRTFVGLNEGDPLPGATALMREEGVNSAVVLRGSDPVGVVDAQEVFGLIADGRNVTDTAVSDAMRNSVTTVTPDRPLTEAIETISDGDARLVVVVEGGEVVGVLSEQDIVTAQSVLSSEPSEPDGVMAAATDRGMTAEVGDAVFSEQGVCEICGSLTRTLESVNGQTICADCRDI